MKKLVFGVIVVLLIMSVLFLQRTPEVESVQPNITAEAVAVRLYSDQAVLDLLNYCVNTFYDEEKDHMIETIYYSTETCDEACVRNFGEQSTCILAQRGYTQVFVPCNTTEYGNSASLVCVCCQPRPH